MNGEIYNSRELAAELELSCDEGIPDTVLVALWLHEKGRQGLVDLKGEFSLAFWDSRRSGLLLAKDIFGCHPLYYAMQEKGLAFGSSSTAVSSLLGYENICPNKVADLLWYGVTPTGSVYQRVERVKAGSYVWFDQENIETGGFVTWADGRPDFDCEKLGREIRSSISQRVCNVSAGLTWSGGLDSSLLFELWPAEARKTAFTMPVDSISRNVDRSSHIQLSAEALRTSVHKVASVAGRPMTTISSVAFAVLASTAASQGIEVMLGGEGADEIFSGYQHYLEDSPGHPQLVRKHWQRAALGSWLELNQGPPMSLQLNEYLNTPEPLAWLEFDRSIRLPEHLMPMNSDIPNLLSGIESRTPYLGLVSSSHHWAPVSLGSKQPLRNLAGSLGIPDEAKRGVFVTSRLLGRQWFETALSTIEESPLSVDQGIGPAQVRSIKAALAAVGGAPGSFLDEALLRLVLGLWSLQITADVRSHCRFIANAEYYTMVVILNRVVSMQLNTDKVRPGEHT